jgi:hypothetical protein
VSRPTNKRPSDLLGFLADEMLRIREALDRLADTDDDDLLDRLDEDDLLDRLDEACEHVMQLEAAPAPSASPAPAPAPAAVSRDTRRR